MNRFRQYLGHFCRTRLQTAVLRAFLGLVLLLLPVTVAAAGTWTHAAPLHDARGYHTATLLSTGQVLVAGGLSNSGFLLTAELYDPAAGNWTRAGPLAQGRGYHTATLLPNGQVLVAGGNNSTEIIAIAELYDPAAGGWTFTGSLAQGRIYHTATLLPNGQVLVAGGYKYDSSTATNYSLSSAELYDPAANSGAGAWTATGSMTSGRMAHTSTLLANGQVLVVGGFNYEDGSDLANAEIYDPGTRLWTPAGSMAQARESHTATLLANGQVLVAGGVQEGGYIYSCALYDPGTKTWTATGGLGMGRELHTATLLPNGKVLVAGGEGPDASDRSLSRSELYDPAAGLWTRTGPLAQGRESHTATLLPNGQVLGAGGYNYLVDDDLASAELYNAAVLSPGVFTLLLLQ